MGEVIAWIIAAGLIMAAIVFAVWIIAALLARVFSYVLVYWGVALLGGFLAGMIAGAVLPVRVLVGRGKAHLWQITPTDLVGGKVLRGKPRSPNAEYGWDSAWPNYMPFQAREDTKAVAREVRTHVGVFWRWFVARIPKGTLARNSDGTVAAVFRWLGRIIPRSGWIALILPIFLGYLLGAWLSALAWFLVMGVIGVAITALQQLALLLYRLFDISDRQRLNASIMCPHCYGESTLPGYRCSNPDCGKIHWTMLPGPLGLITRRCSCGTRLPNTVSAAARRLTAICPYCKEELAEGSGGRQTVQIAMMGSVAAGKSRLLDALVVEIAKLMPVASGTMTPLNDHARLFLSQAQTRMQQSAATSKTQHERPVGLPFLLTRDTTNVELQVMDAAGEAFTSWDETAKLRYLDTAAGLILALDPLALPGVVDHYNRSRLAKSVLLASGDQEEAYAAAVDRLRAEAVPVGRRGLAVVLTKGDILTQLPVAKDLDVDDSASIRSWLIEHGSDLMVRRFEKDFREVRFFVVDSMREHDLEDRLNPWWVLDWLFSEAQAPLKLGSVFAPPPTVVGAPAAATTSTRA
ncbi:hypothetical protein [Leifsonia sp. NCR5]|uniref:TRAFAC clade GTPase domain-containing protein n=1 Tax=Leifsonia sp. NCR5 TaxID=1978342 RepID=UPI00117A7BCE|nr:hypothetical protein [Leifsonia sp. NCR5]